MASLSSHSRKALISKIRIKVIGRLKLLRRWMTRSSIRKWRNFSKSNKNSKVNMKNSNPRNQSNRKLFRLSMLSRLFRRCSRRNFQSSKLRLCMSNPQRKKRWSWKVHIPSVMKWANNWKSQSSAQNRKSTPVRRPWGTSSNRSSSWLWIPNMWRSSKSIPRHP